MNELELALAAVGRKQLACEKADLAYNNLLAILAGVVSGEISRSQVLVNMTDRSWLVTPKGERPGMPATINGLPVCIVAPPEEVRGSGSDAPEPGKGEL